MSNAASDRAGADGEGSEFQAGKRHVEKQFAEWVGLLEPCEYYSGGTLAYYDQVRQVLEYFDVPEFWREPVRLMSQGATYYSAEAWYTKYVSPSQG